MKSLVVKRSVVLAGHKTSVSLEDGFWRSLKEIAASRRITLSALLTAIDSEHHHGNLSSAVRLFVLNHYREQADIFVGGPLNPVGAQDIMGTALRSGSPRPGRLFVPCQRSL
jgi:predicted DNA-binding ribbon-helix-helix protein